MEYKVDIKPLTVNRAWQGRRFKTPAYKEYRQTLQLILPNIELPAPPYLVKYEWGLSNNLSDYDNPIKPFQDAVADKYGFDDKHIVAAYIRKRIVPKGQEYVKFRIEHFEEDLW